MAVEGKAGNALCKVAQTFQVRIDFEHGKHKAQVDGNGVVKGNDVLHVAVYFQFESIDATFAHQYLLGQFPVQRKHGITCTVELIIYQGPHFVYFLFQQDEFRFDKLHHNVSILRLLLYNLF